MVDIFDWNDLNNLGDTQNADLRNDLDSNTTGYAGIGDSWTGLFEYEFVGTAYSGDFDGNGYAIKDVVSTGISAFMNGIQFGSVRNLTLEYDLTPDDDFFIGGIVGRIHSSPSIIQNCAVFGNIDLNVPDSAIESVGLVAGQTETSGNVSNCYAIGQIQNASSDVVSVGGITGRNSGITEDCYAFCEFNNVNTTAYGAAAGGTNNYFSSTVAGFTTTQSGETDLTTAQMTGTDASNNMSLDFTNTWKEQP